MVTHRSLNNLKIPFASPFKTATFAVRPGLVETEGRGRNGVVHGLFGGFVWVFLKIF